MKRLSTSKSAVIIGAGLAGLTAAITLKTAGFKVTLLEKNSHFGGKLNSEISCGFNFELGPSLLTMPRVFEKLFQAAGKNFHHYVRLERLPLEWRAFFVDGKRIDFYSHMNQIQQKNPELGRKDINALRDYLNYSQQMFDQTREGYLRLGLDTTRDIIQHYGLFKTFRGFDVFLSMSDVIFKYISNPYLRTVLNSFSRYIGSSPYRAPAVMNLLPHIQHKFGLWHVSGGMQNLARALYLLARELGVDFYFRHQVTAADIQNRRVLAVSTDRGSIFSANYFLSNMEVIPFYQRITGEDEEFLSQYSQYEPSCSGYAIHLGVEKNYSSLTHHNLFFSSNPRDNYRSVFKNYRLPEDPTIYLTAPANSRLAAEDRQYIKILVHIPYLQQESFSPEEYQGLEKRILTKLENMGLKNLRDRIICKRVLLPEEIESFYFSNRGSLYGIVADMDKNRGLKAPKESEKYNNLFFAGSSVNPGGGMPMGVLSGRQAADKIISQEDNSDAKN